MIRPNDEQVPLVERVIAGQTWREVDDRFERFVKVLFIDEESGSVLIKSNGYRPTIARMNRFNGKRGGYKLVSTMDGPGVDGYTPILGEPPCQS